VERRNIGAMQEILRKAFTTKNTPPPFQYVPYHARYHNIQTFGKAILKQATIEEDPSIVAIQGIHPENMFKFESTLRQKFPKIHSLLDWQQPKTTATVTTRNQTNRTCRL
jgi:hypothetical protein